MSEISSHHCKSLLDILRTVFPHAILRHVNDTRLYFKTLIMVAVKHFKVSGWLCCMSCEASALKGMSCEALALKGIVRCHNADYNLTNGKTNLVMALSPLLL